MPSIPSGLPSVTLPSAAPVNSPAPASAPPSAATPAPEATTEAPAAAPQPLGNSADADVLKQQLSQSSGTSATDAYWDQQPAAVQQLRTIADPSQRAAVAAQLVSQGYQVDVPTMVWGWSPQTSSGLASSFGYTWQPSAQATTSPQTANSGDYSLVLGGQNTAGQFRTDVSGFNSEQYATDQDAQQLAELLGGTVSQTAPSMYYNIPQQNQIDMPDGLSMNAGLTQQMINDYGLDRAKQMIAAEMADQDSGTPGSSAGQTLDTDFGATLPASPSTPETTAAPASSASTEAVFGSIIDLTDDTTSSADDTSTAQPPANSPFRGIGRPTSGDPQSIANAVNSQLSMIRQPSSATVQDENGISRPMPGSLLSSPEQAQAAVQLFAGLGFPDQEVDEQTPDSGATVDYGSEQRRTYAVGNQNVGLLMERYAMYPRDVADQMTKSLAAQSLGG
jgi:hypothetical protein